jgi:hypothetical protein
MSKPTHLNNPSPPPNHPPPFYKQKYFTSALTIIVGAGLMIASRFCSSRQWSIALKWTGGLVLVNGIFEVWKAFSKAQPICHNKASQPPVELSVESKPPAPIPQPSIKPPPLPTLSESSEVPLPPVKLIVETEPPVPLSQPSIEPPLPTPSESSEVPLPPVELSVESKPPAPIPQPSIEPPLPTPSESSEVPLPPVELSVETEPPVPLSQPSIEPPLPKPSESSEVPLPPVELSVETEPPVPLSQPSIEPPLPKPSESSEVLQPPLELSVESKPLASTPQPAATVVPHYRVRLWIPQIQGGGYIGNPEVCYKRHPSLAKFTLENGDLIPLISTDFFVRVSIWDRQKQPNIPGMPNDIYFPYIFLKDLQVDNAYRFRYKSLLFEFFIDKEFIGMLSLVRLWVARYCQIENPLFSMTLGDPTWFYRLGEQGSIFKIDSQNRFVERPQTEFRQKKSPNLTHGAVRIKDGKAVFNWVMSIAKFADIDLIINKEGLILYAAQDHTPGFAPPPPDATIISKCDDEMFMQHVTGKYELIFSISWKSYPEFQSINLDNIKKAATSEKITAYKGFFTWSFQLEHSYPDRILCNTFNDPRFSG